MYKPPMIAAIPATAAAIADTSHTRASESPAPSLIAYAPRATAAISRTAPNAKTGFAKRMTAMLSQKGLCRAEAGYALYIDLKGGVMKDYVAVAETTIDATPVRVWSALTDPAEIEQYMFGSKVVTDWEPGSRIVWRGEYEGKRYEDHGEILEVEPEKRLVMTHYSPLNGKEDAPENYHRLAYELEEVDGETRLQLSQDNNASAEEAEHSKGNWEKMLEGLKSVIERSEARSAGAAGN
jgi:uncharacterized protein YndB with AHSA1/START domain